MPPEERTALYPAPDVVTEEEAWEQCPCPETCRKVGIKHACLECWDDAGDVVAGLRLQELANE